MKENECSICHKMDSEAVRLNICAVQHYLCRLCHKKLYYHFLNIIVDKIKHP